jgi:hypothetical protein
MASEKGKNTRFSGRFQSIFNVNLISLTDAKELIQRRKTRF